MSVLTISGEDAITQVANAVRSSSSFDRGQWSVSFTLHPGPPVIYALDPWEQ